MRPIPLPTLLTIQGHFHNLIQQRAAGLPELQKDELPNLAALVSASDTDKPKGWFSVSGMHGGFSYWFEGDGETAKLVVESWSRVIEGSGQRHEITSHDAKLVDEGFA